MGSKKMEVICPCCETKLQVDKKTGEVIWEKRKEKVMPSLSDMVKDLDHHKKEQESLFKRRSEVQKDRDRLLEEKFKEAQKNVDKSSDLPLRDIDLD
ncbi:2-nitropropane dioxygenase [Candidatus Nitromaritima sp. SCGC AAA799-C22]|nr:2-nitropropane dioxygenase [Candidatus Nitromaritima sp. SCGC AAA799-C22]